MPSVFVLAVFLGCSILATDLCHLPSTWENYGFYPLPTLLLSVYGILPSLNTWVIGHIHHQDLHLWLLDYKNVLRERRRNCQLPIDQNTKHFFAACSLCLAALSAHTAPIGFLKKLIQLLFALPPLPPFFLPFVILPPCLPSLAWLGLAWRMIFFSNGCVGAFHPLENPSFYHFSNSSSNRYYYLANSQQNRPPDTLVQVESSTSTICGKLLRYSPMVGK
jgi:hypothetical protein